MSRQQEIRSLTGLRGVAAVYVVLHHYFLGLAFKNPFSNFLAHGYLAVDLFFVLSGFVMSLNYGHMFRDGWSLGAFRTFLGRRVARVYPLYLVATSCAFLLILAGWLGNPVSGSLKVSFVQNLTMVQAWGFGPSLDAPGWSISAEWAAYLLFPALLSMAFFRSRFLAWLAGALCVAALSILCLLPATMVNNHRPLAILDLHASYYAFPVWRCLPEFTLGILAARLMATQSIEWIVSRRWFAVTVCLVVVSLLTVTRTDLAVVLLSPLLILCLVPDNNLLSLILKSRPVHYLGVLSYSIYLVHDLLGGLLGWTHRWVEAHGLPHPQTFAALVCIVLTFPISVVAYKCIESPGRRFFRTLFEEKRVSPFPEPTALASPK